MKPWLVRLVSNEAEEHALVNGELSVPFVISDPAELRFRSAVYDAVQRAYPGTVPELNRKLTDYVHFLLNELPDGAFIVTPIPSVGEVAIGRVTGGATLNPEGYPARNVQWLHTGLRLDLMKPDLQEEFGGSESFRRIKRAGILNRLQTLANVGHDSGPQLRTEIPAKGRKAVRKKRSAFAEWESQRRIERKKRIEEGHKVSGFKSIGVHFVQGGAPGKKR